MLSWDSNHGQQDINTWETYFCDNVIESVLVLCAPIIIFWCNFVRDICQLFSPLFSKRFAATIALARSRESVWTWTDVVVVVMKKERRLKKEENVEIKTIKDAMKKYKEKYSGALGRAVASETRHLQFESSHRQILYYLCTVNYIEKTKIQKKRQWISQFFYKKTGQ